MGKAVKKHLQKEKQTSLSSIMQLNVTAGHGKLILSGHLARWGLFWKVDNIINNLKHFVSTSQERPGIIFSSWLNSVNVEKRGYPCFPWEYQRCQKSILTSTMTLSPPKSKIRSHLKFPCKINLKRIPNDLDFATHEKCQNRIQWATDGELGTWLCFCCFVCELLGDVNFL